MALCHGPVYRGPWLSLSDCGLWKAGVVLDKTWGVIMVPVVGAVSPSLKSCMRAHACTALQLCP